MNKLNKTKQKGKRTLIAISIIAVAVYIGFEPLFEFVPSGVAQSVVGASFGAIFVIILTMYLLNKQTEIYTKYIHRNGQMVPCGSGFQINIVRLVNLNRSL